MAKHAMEKEKPEKKRNKAEKKEKKAMNINKRKILIIVFELIFIFCVIGIVLRFIGKKVNPDDMQNVLDNIVIDVTQINDQTTERMLKIRELQKQNSDIVGWLEIEGTYISEPVLQAKDNDYYLDHDYKKESTKKGALFLDSTYNWTVPSTNLLIYGHNNTYDHTRFADLKLYKEESYYKEHPTIRFTTANEDATYEIIAVFLSRVYYKNETNVFRYYYFINAETEEEFNDYVENAKKASLYNIEKTAEYGDQLLTLSTCDTYTQDGRLAIVARKVK